MEVEISGERWRMDERRRERREGKKRCEVEYGRERKRKGKIEEKVN